MSRKRSLTIAILCLLLLAGALATAAVLSGGRETAEPSSTSDPVAAAMEKGAQSDVLATNGNWTVTVSDVAQKLSGGFLPAEGGGQTPLTPSEALEALVLERILYEEAKAQGLLPTEEEAKEHVAIFLAQYEAHPEDFPEVEAYCQANDISFEECVRRMEEDTRLVFGIARLEELYAQVYCQEKGIEFSSVNQSREVRDAVEQKKTELLEARRGEIRYRTEDAEQQS